MVDLNQMICSILLLLSLTSCVRGGFWSVNYDAEENSNVTVELSFSSRTNIPVGSVKIHCVMAIPMQDVKVFFSLDPSVVELQHEQFAGRVQCDTDAIRTGRVRLHLSRLRTNDSGPYLCIMMTEEGRKVKDFSLNVTEAVEKPKPVTLKPAPETPKPAPQGRDRICLYVALGLTAAAAAALCLFVCTAKMKLKAGPRGGVQPQDPSAAPCWMKADLV